MKPAPSFQPHFFYKLLNSTLEANEFEIVDRQLTRFLNEGSDASIVDSVNNYRSANGIHEQGTAFTDIRQAMTDNGYSVFHTFLSSFSARIMRPGSNEDTDYYFKLGVNKWKEEEDRLGIEIDARIFSYYWSNKEIEGRRS